MCVQSRVLVALIFLFQVVPLQAQQQNNLPLLVEQELARMDEMCRDVGGKPMESPELLAVADLTGDGLLDFVVNQGAFNCEGAASLFSGSGGSQIMAYVGSTDGQVIPAFGSWSFGVRIDESGDQAKLYIVLGGPLCGQRVTEDTPRSDYKSCWRPVDWNDKTRTLELAPVSDVQFLP